MELASIRIVRGKCLHHYTIFRFNIIFSLFLFICFFPHSNQLIHCVTRSAELFCCTCFTHTRTCWLTYAKYIRMMCKMHENIPIYMKFILKIVFHVDAVYLIAARDDAASIAILLLMPLMRLLHGYTEYLLPTPNMLERDFFHDPIALNIFEHKYFKHFELMFFSSHFWMNVNSETDARFHTNTHTTRTYAHFCHFAGTYLKFVTLLCTVYAVIQLRVCVCAQIQRYCVWASFIESRFSELKCSILRFPLLMSKTSLQITTT